MLEDKDYINWLNATRDLVNKYNLKQISITMKDKLNIKVKDVHGFVMDDTSYDILEAGDIDEK